MGNEESTAVGTGGAGPGGAGQDPFSVASRVLAAPPKRFGGFDPAESGRCLTAAFDGTLVAAAAAGRTGSGDESPASGGGGVGAPAVFVIASKGVEIFHTATGDRVRRVQWGDTFTAAHFRYGTKCGNVLVLGTRRGDVHVISTVTMDFVKSVSLKEESESDNTHSGDVELRKNAAGAASGGNAPSASVATLERMQAMQQMRTGDSDHDGARGDGFGTAEVEETGFTITCVDVVDPDTVIAGDSRGEVRILALSTGDVDVVLRPGLIYQRLQSQAAAPRAKQVGMQDPSIAVRAAVLCRQALHLGNGGDGDGGGSTAEEAKAHAARGGRGAEDIPTVRCLAVALASGLICIYRRETGQLFRVLDTGIREPNGLYYSMKLACLLVTFNGNDKLFAVDLHSDTSQELDFSEEVSRILSRSVSSRPGALASTCSHYNEPRRTLSTGHADGSVLVRQLSRDRESGALTANVIRAARPAAVSDGGKATRIVSIWYDTAFDRIVTADTKCAARVIEQATGIAPEYPPGVVGPRSQPRPNPGQNAQPSRNGTRASQERPGGGGSGGGGTSASGRGGSAPAARGRNFDPANPLQGDRAHPFSIEGEDEDDHVGADVDDADPEAETVDFHSTRGTAV